MYRSTVVLTILILIGSQGGCPKKQPTAKPQPAKQVKPSKASEPKTAPEPKAAPEPDPVVYTPLKTQIGNKATETTFKGWLGKGERFAVQTWRVPFMLGTEDAEETSDLRLTEIHEAITGLYVGSFRISWEEGGNADGTWEPAHKEAKPRKEWKTFVASNPLVNVKPSRISPDGRWALAAKPARRYVGFKLKPEKGGVSYRWDLPSEEEAKPTRPSVDLFLHRREDSSHTEIKVLRFKVPIGRPDEDDARYELTELITGAVNPYWSPDKRRVVLVLTADNNSHKNPDKDARFYVRSLGPQLQLTAPKKDPVAAHRTARRLAKAGLPVARLKLDDKPRSETLIYYRGEHKAQAEAAAKAIGGPCKIEQLKSKGWLHLVILQKS